MCEAHAYLMKDGDSERVMENVISIGYDGPDIVLRDLFGDQMRLRARIREVALIEHKIFLEPVEEDAASA